MKIRSTSSRVLLFTATLLTASILSCTTEKNYYTTAPTADLRPPVVTWIAPVGGSTVQGVLDFELIAEDESGIDSLRIFIDGSSRPMLFSLGQVDSLYQLDWDSRSDSDGVHIFEARAYDKAGNIGTSPTLALRISNATSPPPPDRAPPVITWFSPEAGSIIRDTIGISFLVQDSSMIDSVKLYVNGEVASILAGRNDSLYTVELNSWRFSNGRQLLELRAWDSTGNVGVSEPLGITIDNHRVIWVPDDYVKIQDAINASVDGDTIMVRAGEYHEQLQFFDKNVSFVSESGPEETILDGTDYYTAAWITGGQDTTMLVRGFTFRNLGDFPAGRYGGYFVGSSPKIVNNIFIGVPNIDRRGMQVGQNNAIIRNNLFITLYSGIEIGHSWGSDFSNNMLIDIQGYGLFSVAATGQFLAPDYNLFWNVGHYDSSFFNYGPHNIIGVEPQFAEDTYQLLPESAGIDNGRHDLYDLDGTVSDIGVYGGPLQYPPPNR